MCPRCVQLLLYSGYASFPRQRESVLNFSDIACQHSLQFGFLLSALSRDFNFVRGICSSILQAQNWCSWMPSLSRTTPSLVGRALSLAGGAILQGLPVSGRSALENRLSLFYDFGSCSSALVLFDDFGSGSSVWVPSMYCGSSLYSTRTAENASFSITTFSSVTIGSTLSTWWSFARLGS